jgi:hypothetical protein
VGRSDLGDSASGEIVEFLLAETIDAEVASDPEEAQVIFEYLIDTIVKETVLSCSG